MAERDEKVFELYTTEEEARAESEARDNRAGRSVRLATVSITFLTAAVALLAAVSWVSGRWLELLIILFGGLVAATFFRSIRPQLSVTLRRISVASLAVAFVLLMPVSEPADSFVPLGVLSTFIMTGILTFSMPGRTSSPRNTLVWRAGLLVILLIVTLFASGLSPIATSLSFRHPAVEGFFAGCMAASLVAGCTMLVPAVRLPLARNISLAISLLVVVMMVVTVTIGGLNSRKGYRLETTSGGNISIIQGRHFLWFNPTVAASLGNIEIPGSTDLNTFKTFSSLHAARQKVHRLHQQQAYLDALAAAANARDKSVVDGVNQVLSDLKQSISAWCQIWGPNCHGQSTWALTDQIFLGPMLTNAQAAAAQLGSMSDLPTASAPVVFTLSNCVSAISSWIQIQGNAQTPVSNAGKIAACKSVPDSLAFSDSSAQITDVKGSWYDLVNAEIGTG